MTKSFWSLWCKIFCIDLLVLETVLAEAWSKGISLCNLLGGINGRVSTTCKSDVFSKAELFDDVRKIHFKSYFRYLIFDIGRIGYLQANVLSAYVFLAPAIVAGVVTLGVMQQIIRAFNKVEGSFQYILKSWPQIIELASVYKRLREFEDKLKSSEEKDTIELK